MQTNISIDKIAYLYRYKNSSPLTFTVSNMLGCCFSLNYVKLWELSQLKSYLRSLVDP